MKNRTLFIDVGVGTLNSEAWKREVGFTIIGLEPATHRFNKLKDYYPGQLLNKLASDKNGEMTCWEDRVGGVVLAKRPEIHDKFIKTTKESITLDSLDWKDFDEIHIWADIEGAELLMLKGATEMLSSGKVKWILLEVRATSPAEGWASAQEVYEFLDRHEFKPNVLLHKLKKSGHRDITFLPKE